MCELPNGQWLGRLKKESVVWIILLGEDKVEKSFSGRRNSVQGFEEMTEGNLCMKRRKYGALRMSYETGRVGRGPDSEKFNPKGDG